MSTKSKIVLVTGATSGIGRTTALHLAKQGHHVIASGRRAGELLALKTEAAGLRLDTLVLDVTSKESIHAAVAEVERLTSGRGLDVLLNNAGFGVLGPSSEISDAEMRRQYDTNVFGLMAVTRAFLPRMRERGAGRIVNVSSVGGRITLPFFGVYNSTKYAVESLSDALRYELRPFGIDVVLVEPGVIRTNFESTAVADMKQYANTPYGYSLTKYDEISKMADKVAAEPIVIAKAIARAVNARRPAARYVAPRSTYFMIWFQARTAPTAMWDWAMRKVAYLTKKNVAKAATAAASRETAAPKLRARERLTAIAVPPARE